MRNIKFRLSRWHHTLIFEIMQVDTTFWNKLNTLLSPSLTYTTTAGVVVTVNNTASSISSIASNAFTISNQLNISLVAFADDTIRDTNYRKIVSSLKELIQYVNNNGTISQICTDCLNYGKVREQWCSWIVSTAANWDGSTDKCSHYNEVFDTEEYFEYYDI